MPKPLDLESTRFEVFDARISVTNVALPRAASALSAAKAQSITIRDVERALVDVLELDEIFDLLYRDIDSDMIVALLKDYDFTIRPQKVCEVEFEESILPPDYPIALQEARVKLKGEIWVAYKYDRDPFPSNPHAHNYDRKLKMHLGTGDVYAGRDRVPCERIRKADLLTLRMRITQKNSSIPLPPLAV